MTKQTVPDGLVRRWKNASRYSRRRDVAGRWHAYDVREATSPYDADHYVRPETALCGRVDERFIYYNTNHDPLDLSRMRSSWSKVCVKCAAMAGMELEPAPQPKETHPVSEPKGPAPTPGPALPGGLKVVNQSDLPRLLMEHDLYYAVATALIDSDVEAIDYLRGLATLGLIIGPNGPTEEEQGADAVESHRLVMATLERLGVEPKTEEQVRVEMESAARNAGAAMARIVELDRPPTLIQADRPPRQN